MKIVDRLTSWYADFVVRKPWVMIFLVLLITCFLFIQSQNVQTVSADNSDALPDDIDVIKAFDKISDKFGGSDSAMIVFELDPNQKFGVSDIRDVDVFTAMSLVGDLAGTLDDIQSVSSPATIIKSYNNGLLPNSNREIIDLTKDNSLFNSYIGERYDVAVVSLSLADGYSDVELLDELQSIITQVPLPPGVIVSVGGDVLAGAVVSQTISSDMGKTSMFSLIGIIFVLIIVFRSIKYASMPLITIGVGVLWTMGYIGLMGMNLSSMTSGVISMIMGIGIDFGIQIVSRFRQELRNADLKSSMRTTLAAVFLPMTTTTLAAVIGFKAMGFGDLTFLAEMGQMMSYGVVGCYFAALLIIPAVLVIFETVFSSKNKTANLIKVKKVIR